MNWTTSEHQQTVFLSMGASGSVWELSDKNPRAVKFQSSRDGCSDLGCIPECRRQICNHIERPVSTREADGKTQNMSGST